MIMWTAVPVCLAMLFQVHGTVTKPNIVFILADDLGWKDSGVYGSTYYQTPNVDRLAGQGMRFTEAYSASPLCSPTRASIMTGQYPARVGITAAMGHVAEVRLNATISTTAGPLYKAITPKSATRLDTAYYTIAEALKDAGYQTAHFGKWHLGSDEFMAKFQGFDVTMGGGGYACPNSYFSPYKMTTVPDGPVGEHIDRKITEEAVKFIREHKNEPFYLNLWLYDVHGPFQTDADLIQKYELLKDPGNPQHFPLMGAMIETMDDCVGRIINELSALGLDRNTLVIFTSDNGGLVDEDNYYSKEPPTSNAPLRAGKSYNYEGGTRVPLIMRWPGKIEAGAVCSSLVSSVDFYPTLLAATGASGKSDQLQDGINLLPVATGKIPAEDRNIFSFFPHYVNYVTDRFLVEPGAYVRQGDYKLIRFFARGSGGQDDLELYDLKEDIGETENLAALMPEKTAALNALLGTYLIDSGACVPFANSQYDPNVRMIQIGNTYITYSQQDQPFVFVFNSNLMQQRAGSVKILLNQPCSGKILWTTEVSTRLADHTVGFLAEDFSTDGEVTVPFGDGDSRIKDVRIEVYGSVGEPFRRIAILNEAGTTVLSVDI
ncbi:MAG: sulfatase [Kiritimatiellales bacterium]|nr:sulfatase [Kiritimatiellales bacterium]MCF7863763.1 sulfatase [Kiritimatiellales bacterium]